MRRGWARAALVAAAAVAAPHRSLTAQEVPTYRSSWVDGLSVATAGLLSALPVVLGLPRGSPSCAPCDRRGVPAVDRWAMGSELRVAGFGSDVGLAGVAGLTAVLAWRRAPAAERAGNFAVLANTASWTLASAQWIKVAVRRKRPVLYTSGALAAAGLRDSQQSLPSGHAALAFAAATCYAVLAARQHLEHRRRNSIILFAGAVGVSALRVAAGRHFPTDVAASAGLGIGMGWLIPTLHR